MEYSTNFNTEIFYVYISKNRTESEYICTQLIVRLRSLLTFNIHLRIPFLFPLESCLSISISVHNYSTQEEKIIILKSFFFCL